MNKFRLPLILLFLTLLFTSAFFVYNFLFSKNISLGSEHSLYTVEKTTNFSEFGRYLDKIGFWKTGSIYDPETKSATTAKNLSILLTDKVQLGDGRWVGEGENPELLTAFGYNVNSQEVSLYIFLDPDLAVKEGQNIDEEFNIALMRAVFFLANGRAQPYDAYLSVADELVTKEYKKPLVVVKRKSSSASKLKNLFIKTALASHSGDCQSWRCGTGIRRCVGGVNNNKTCNSNFDCPGGTCSFSSCSAAYWEGHSGSSCISPACPSGQCVVPGSNHCSCGAPTPPPSCSCSSWSNQGCGGGSCTATQMYQTRNCNLSSCGESQCVSSGSCSPSPTCTVSLTPATATVAVGAATTLTASVTIGSGTVTQVDFLSGNTGIVTVNPASDTTEVYSTQANGISNGSTTVTSNVIMSGATRCSDSSTIDVINPGPWWQVIDADVTTNGDLISPIPGTCSLPACNPVLGLKGAGGFPGVPAYGGATADFLSGAGTGSAAESPYNWLAASRYLGKTYDYAYFERQIPDDIVINEVTPPVTGGTFNSGGTPSRGYVWYHWDGSSLGDLTINGNVNLVGSRRVVLLVEAANFYVNGLINLQSKGNGFFMAVVGKDANGLKGDIIVDPSVSHPTQPELEGIFLAESEFKSGAGSNQLLVRGSVAAYDGVVLQRDLGAGNADTPAEVFEYAPDIIATFPQVFTQRRLRWKEVAP